MLSFSHAGNRRHLFLSEVLRRQFSGCVARGEGMALVTVLSTSGSTYSKPGAQMLVAASESCGIVSGGCLEPDIVARGRRVIETGQTEFASYDLASDDALFGFGVGCEGTVQVGIQALTDNNGFEPMAGLVQALKTASHAEIEIEAGGGETARFTINSAPFLLLLGAGDDVHPLAGFSRQLGWRVTIADHRPSYLEKLPPFGGTSVLVDDGSLASVVSLANVDAVVVMTHNQQRDICYLREVANSDIPYVGLLGPRRRRDRILRELGSVAERLERRLRSPVGTVIGGDGPAAIALEIVAELQAYFVSPEYRSAR